MRGYFDAPIEFVLAKLRPRCATPRGPLDYASPVCREVIGELGLDALF